MDIDENYYRGLIKGKITEVIFEEMFKISEEFTVLQMGYEHTLPQLAQYQKYVQVKKVLENIRHAPDFILISQNKEKVFLVEVKYRHILDYEYLLQQAKEIDERCSPCFIFLATKEKFYFDSCTKIITNNGQISELSEYWISKNVQVLFTKLLNEFI